MTANVSPTNDASLAAVPRANEAADATGASAGPPNAVPQEDLDPVSVSQLPYAAYENRLVEVRLGIASSLFTALRHKHSPTAAHSLRVAMGCSSWAFALGLPSDDRDQLEVAGLLHDVGKIGAPDRLLLKPEELSGDEMKLMDQYRLSGLNILANCCPSQAIVDAIRHSGGWYNGQRPNYPLVAEQIPCNARMLAIVDAFDSMTSDHAYRRAMSRERAMHELFSHAGTQFDPDLVQSFSELRITAQLHRKVIGHWLKTLDPNQSNRFWRNLTAASPTNTATSAEALFQQKLLGNMYDAVIFVDRNMQIIQWNHGAERLTGIAASSVLNRTWSPTLLHIRDARTGVLETVGCPIAYCISSGVQSLQRLLVANRNNQPVVVDVHAVPVIATDGTTYGAAMLLHDVSPETTLEERCHDLRDQATKDPLTQVANRAEFDRVHQLYVTTHLERRLPYSMIMCDIDRFKSINDTYGHQAGDEVLKLFGQLLKSECRADDLVARYGGEEFAILCADCTNAAAAGRGEQLRKAISELPVPALNGKAVTVSFGVTEIQPGDTPESMLSRTDRALFDAKRMGRNIVVQLGDGLPDAADPATRADAPSENENGRAIVDQALLTPVPLSIAIEKLRGFVLDHHAEVLSIEADRVELQIGVRRKRFMQRRSDQRIPFVVMLVFSELQVSVSAPNGQPQRKLCRTQVHVIIYLKCSRDRRMGGLSHQATSILAGIKSYLMASAETELADPNTTRRTVNILAHWFKK